MDKYGYRSSYPFLLDWVHGNEALREKIPPLREYIEYELREKIPPLQEHMEYEESSWSWLVGAYDRWNFILRVVRFDGDRYEATTVRTWDCDLDTQGQANSRLGEVVRDDRTQWRPVDLGSDIFEPPQEER